MKIVAAILLACGVSQAAMPVAERETMAVAIYRAEGAEKSSRPYGLKGGTLAKCYARLDREWDGWLLAGRPKPDFVAWIGAVWCPVGAENDPRNLNRNWIPNVRSIYWKLRKARKI